MPESLSAAAARRIALAAQGFGVAKPATVGTRQLNLTLQRLGVLQIDSVNVFERSHYLPLFARLGAYDKTLLDRLTLKPKAPYLEYWAHVATFVPRDDWPLWRWRMAAMREKYTRPGEWVPDHPQMIEFVLNELRTHGPMAASEIEHEENVRRGPWWGLSDIKEALEYLFVFGDVVTAGRKGFERVYALPEQILSSELLDADIPIDEAQRELVGRAIRSLGIGTAKDVADYYRLYVATAARLLERTRGRRRGRAGESRGLESSRLPRDRRPHPPQDRDGRAALAVRPRRVGTRPHRADVRLPLPHRDLHPRPEADLRLLHAARIGRRGHRRTHRPQERPPGRRAAGAVGVA